MTRHMLHANVVRSWLTGLAEVKSNPDGFHAPVVVAFTREEITALADLILAQDVWDEGAPLTTAGYAVVQAARAVEEEQGSE